MKIIQKIRKLAAGGNLQDALRLAIQSTKDDAPLKESLYLQQQALKNLKRDYRNRQIDEAGYKQELNRIINNFLAIVSGLSKNRKMLKPTGVWTKWWFWPLLLLLLWLAYRYFTYTPPLAPLPKVSLSFEGHQFNLSPSKDSALHVLVGSLNDRHRQKLRLQQALQMPGESPLILFESTEEKMRDTLAVLQQAYQRSITRLEETLIDRHSGYSVYFAPNQAIVPDTCRQAIQAIGKVLQKSSLQLRITGYADSVGSIEANQELSCRRANAVKTYLLESLDGTKLSDSRFSIDCKGEQVLSSGLQGGSQANRRVELTFTKL